jgi:large subunit ribosomal protein L21
MQSRSQKIRQAAGRGKGKGDSMYAVIRTGGKQYCVAAGDTLEVEKLVGNIGEAITLSDVLLVSRGDTVTVGAPNVDGATVSAKITGQYRGNKIQVFKYRPKKRIRVRRGHRQYLTRLQIEAINA